MTDAAKPLKELKKDKPFLVGIDSDGCAFDTMEIKQKECFVPNIIRFFDLQPIAKYVRETVEFVNLYSKWRGVNRWPALIMVFDLLEQRDEVVERAFSFPNIGPLREWVKCETKWSNPALSAEVEKTKDSVLANALEWSKKVNADIAEMVHDIPPFPYMRESLEKLAEIADVIVVSQTPCEALTREWREHGIDKFVKVIAGQEMGTKGEHLAYAMEGRFQPREVLMIGDALGDMKAARANGTAFCPINPGHEEASWKRFHQEGLARFVAGTFQGEYEAGLVAEFERYLPEVPPWKTHKL
jgi:phosphoglycolate phosphatase-like HAD superfamily hydrolase